MSIVTPEALRGDCGGRLAIGDSIVFEGFALEILFPFENRTEAYRSTISTVLVETVLDGCYWPGGLLRGLLHHRRLLVRY